MRTRIALVFAVLLLLVTGAVWFASLESTLRWAAGKAQTLSRGALVVERPSGSLLSRMHAAHLRWRDPKHAVEASNVELRWSPLWILVGVIALDRIHAQDIIVHSSNDNAPAALPTSLRPPLPIRLTRVSTDVLRIDDGTRTQEFRGMEGSAESSTQAWNIRLADTATPWGTVRASGSIGTNAPFETKLDARLRQAATQSGPAVALDAHAEGTLQQLDIKATGKAADTEADARLTLAVGAPQPVRSIEATLRNLDPHRLISAAPAAAIEATLQAATGEDGKLHGTLRVDNRNSGTLDRNQLPFSSIVADVGATPDALGFDPLRLDTGAGGQLLGRANISSQGIEVALRSDALNLHALHAGLRPTKLNGSLGSTGDLASQRIRLDLKEQGMALQLDATVAADRIAITRALASASGGSAEVSGNLALDPQRSFAVKAKLNRFDPARFGSFRKASINANLSAEGAISPVLQLRSDFTLSPSTLFDLPSSGHGRWRSRGIEHPDIAVDVDAKIGDTHIAAQGTLLDPQALRALDLNLTLEGRDLGQLYQITGVPLPQTADYRINGRLAFRDSVWSLKQFEGHIGRSDLAGYFTVDLSGPRRVMRGDLTSQRLDVRDLGGFIGADMNPAPNASTDRVIAQKPYDLNKLNAADADVLLTGQSIRNERLPLEQMTSHLRLDHGVLTLDPLHFSAASGEIDARVKMNARQAPIETIADIQARGLALNRVAPGVKELLGSTGTIEGRTQLTMHGNSLAAMLGSADGNMVLLMNGGSASDLTLRLANLDIANALAAMAQGDRKVPIRCVVADLQANAGVLTPKTLVMDTETTRLDGQGQVNLRDETLALRLIASPKTASVLALRGPILLEGKFAQPSVRPDLTNAVVRTGAAVALGAVAGPLAALPFVQAGSASDVDCDPLVTDASRFLKLPSPVANTGPTPRANRSVAAQ